MPTVFDAIEFAARAHAGQYRKGTRLPYIIHPLSVARILIECGASEELVVAALLHDTVEDTPVTLSQLQETFGTQVARLVEAMSEPDKSDTWENRKRDTLEFLETAPPDVLLIQVADKLDNVRSIREDLAREGDALWKRFHRGRAQQKWYHERLADLFARRLDAGCGAALAREFRDRVRAVFGEKPANRLESGEVSSRTIPEMRDMRDDTSE